MTDSKTPRPIRVAIVRYQDDHTDLGVIYLEHDPRTKSGYGLTVVWPNLGSNEVSDADPVIKRAGRFTMTDSPDHARLTTVRRLWKHPVPHGRSLEDDAAQRVRYHRSGAHRL
jgi:hypothetical protein